MLLDAYFFIVMEQTGFPGNIGDSCAETSRWLTLEYVNKESQSTDLSPFVTDKGVLRHPTSPWRENDTSDDQVSPLIAASSLKQPQLADKIITQIKSAGWRTGNGDRIHPSVYAQIKRHEGSRWQWIWDISIIGEALFLKFPIRWSESKRWFELTSGSSSDYLNFINFLAFAKAKGNFSWACKLATKIIDKNQALSKVHSYYLPEPNNQLVVDAYDKAASQIW